jgi:hypothetical protein
MIGRNLVGAILVGLVLSATPSFAAERKRGEAGSDERRLYCGHRLSDCIRDSQQSCRNQHSGSGDILDCYETKKRVCEESWGTNSDCVTRAVGPATGVPRIEGGTLDAGQSTPPSNRPTLPRAPTGTTR